MWIQTKKQEIKRIINGKVHYFFLFWSCVILIYHKDKKIKNTSGKLPVVFLIYIKVKIWVKVSMFQCRYGISQALANNVTVWTGREVWLHRAAAGHTQRTGWSVHFSYKLAQLPTGLFLYFRNITTVSHSENNVLFFWFTALYTLPPLPLSIHSTALPTTAALSPITLVKLRRRFILLIVFLQTATKKYLRFDSNKKSVSSTSYLPSSHLSHSSCIHSLQTSVLCGVFFFGAFLSHCDILCFCLCQTKGSS